MKNHPEVQFGDSLLESLKLDPERTVVTAMELPWEIASLRLPFTPASVVFVQTMERVELDRIAETVPDFDVVVGIGGGMCMDCAKYLSWKRASTPDSDPVDRVGRCMRHTSGSRP
jgi:hypothetical protein